MTVHLSKALQTHRRRERVVIPSVNTSKPKIRQECTRVRGTSSMEEPRSLLEIALAESIVDVVRDIPWAG
jgi:hypothetical protein